MQALRRNPYAPEVPCHRVIAASLDLGGFSGQWGAQQVICFSSVLLLLPGIIRAVLHLSLQTSLFPALQAPRCLTCKRKKAMLERRASSLTGLRWWMPPLSWALTTSIGSADKRTCSRAVNRPQT